ncbi:hypothetical protein OG21DRAFT_1492228, partial [Imleria badia]
MSHPNEEVVRTNSFFDALKAQHATVQHNNFDLHSALNAEKGAVVKANQTISNLQSDLETTQSNNSNLQSELRGLKREVADDKRTLSLGIADFKQWMRENSVKADKLISDPDPSVSSSDIHHVLAHNALVKVGLDKWSSAYEDAKK